MSFQIKEDKDIIYGEFTEFGEQKVFAGISFRRGGYSSPPFDSLNLGLHTEDNKTDVLKNRELFFKSLNIDHRDIVALKQVHSNKVVVVNKDNRGRGALDYEDSFTEADAVVTKDSGVPLVIFVADCMPIFFMDTEERIIGICHAGWKGTFHRIAEKIVEVMEQMGGGVKNIIAGLGPAIGSCCYEVGNDVVEKFNNKFIEIINKRYYFNLDKANTEVLVSSGIKKENIIHSNFCTCCNTDVCFSYRKEKQTGRMAGVIMLWE